MANDAATPAGDLTTTSTEGAAAGSATMTDEVDSDALPRDVADGDDEPNAGDETASPSSRPALSQVRLATLVGLVVVIALGGMVGWLGFRENQSRQGQEERSLFLQAARQGAVNLTTIDAAHADADIQRILDSATGTFYDDFSTRSGPFTEVVKQAKSKSVGTVTEAGLESVSGDEAQVLVAVTVKTSLAGAPEQDPRAWRMRVSVQRMGGEAKVSNVAFVP